jgi:hypothetical protein
MNRFLLFSWLLIGSACGLVDATQTGQESTISVVMTGSSRSMAKTLVSNGDTLVISEVKMYLDELELESDNEDSLDFELENALISIPVDGTPYRLTDRVVPAGIYKEFELKVERPDDSNPRPADTDFWDETGRYSVVVKGTWNGQPFTYRSSQDLEIEIEFNPELVVDENNGYTIELNVDYGSWFTANGIAVDPSSALNRSGIESRMRNSFNVLSRDDDDDDDRDRDGDDDNDDEDDDADEDENEDEDEDEDDDNDD